MSLSQLLYALYMKIHNMKKDKKSFVKILEIIKVCVLPGAHDGQWLASYMYTCRSRKTLTLLTSLAVQRVNVSALFPNIFCCRRSDLHCNDVLFQNS